MLWTQISDTLQNQAETFTRSSGCSRLPMAHCYISPTMSLTFSPWKNGKIEWSGFQQYITDKMTKYRLQAPGLGRIWNGLQCSVWRAYRNTGKTHPEWICIQHGNKILWKMSESRLYCFCWQFLYLKYPKTLNFCTAMEELNLRLMTAKQASHTKITFRRMQMSHCMQNISEPITNCLVKVVSCNVDMYGANPVLETMISAVRNTVCRKKKSISSGRLHITLY